MSSHINILPWTSPLSTNPSSTPKPPAYLSSTLIGTWSLQSYNYHPLSSPTTKHHPLSSNAQGSIVYSPDGYMSASVVRPGQPHFSDGGGLAPDTSGTLEDWELVGRNFIAYSGRYWVADDEETGREVVWHEMSVCSLPSLRGVVAKRSARLEEVDGVKVLTLGVEGVELGGEECEVEVVWRRCEDNAGTKMPGA
ncbi:hypothetical protein EK21DRAFT_87054 [Setomelanomma holmii]|uniref:Lipocalin-like domain-containing protein n=1 Tax=Setomelanomma holmii TaxID=210430 RepID=A0A9P4HG86_9PLEO|nr:hypothetical protein EK21DRAFT_87054 [Setomelanomma holmii]